MELVLVGLPGSGKSAVGRRLAALHEAEFVDLDGQIESQAGRSVSEIFAEEGESGFRGRESAAIEALGSTDTSRRLRRVIASGGGAVLAPRNRWRLYRGRHAAWLHASPQSLARRTRFGGGRPLLAGRDPVTTLRDLADRRLRFYAAARRIDGEGPRAGVIARLERLVAGPAPVGTSLLHAATPVGELHIGSGDASGSLMAVLEQLGPGRVAFVSEPEAWRLHGERLAAAVTTAGLRCERLELPRGEEAKTLAVLETVVRGLAKSRLERGDPVVAVGGGAVGDVAGFAAAVYLRGVPLVQVPTTLLAQIDSAIGGKTGVDLPEGKNLVGAFHPPVAVIADVELLQTLPERERRAALGEAVKYAALGDEALLELLERDGPALASGAESAFESGALAELVERCAWRKVEIVSADPQERDAGGRVALNLGHSIGHALEAASGYQLLHGEAVAHGLRGALAVGRSLGVTPPERAARIGALIDRLGLADGAPKVDLARVRQLLAADKKHAGGQLRWVLVDETGVTVRADVPDGAVEAGLAAALGGRA
jgi:3-dehydroquinate synthase